MHFPPKFLQKRYPLLFPHLTSDITPKAERR